MKAVSFDPRAWNLLAGLCLTNSCGDRTIVADDGDTNASGTDTQSTESTTETGGSECRTSADCPDGYYCLDGACDYRGGPDVDGYECTFDADCDVLEWCLFGYCYTLPHPADCPPPPPALEIPEMSLSLSFADVDADGAEELVAATASELHVYESGSDIPIVSPRGLDSNSVAAMVGGAFDGIAGDDVVILFDDELRLHGSDGMGNFAAPSVSPTPWPDSVGLIAGEFDNADPADILIWAHSGAGVALGSGSTIDLSGEDISSATARSFAEPFGGFVLEHNGTLDFFNIAGGSINSVETIDGPHVLTSSTNLGDSLDWTASTVAGESTLIRDWGPATGNNGSYWGLYGLASQIAGGDFDGDDGSDIAVLGNGPVQIMFGLLQGGCIASYPFASVAVGLAVGDHDGDGDDELAVRFEDGHIALIDGE